MRYGVAERDLGRVAVNYVTGPPQLPLIPIALRRALGVAHEEAVRLSNDPRFLLGIIPSGNVVTTADELSRFYQLLLNGGEIDGVRIFEPRTIRRATTEQSYLEFDLTIGLPVRYGMGFMLGGQWFSFYGPDTEHAYGHVGFTNVISWADPARQVSAALMTSGKPLIYPQIYYAYDVLRQIGLAAPRHHA
jgi:CubicO group peptidase (beta-lactamase class C family)